MSGNGVTCTVCGGLWTPPLGIVLDKRCPVCRTSGGLFLEPPAVTQTILRDEWARGLTDIDALILLWLCIDANGLGAGESSDSSKPVSCLDESGQS